MGGKSRKSGGVSKKLIAQIKSGAYLGGNTTGKKSSCGTTKKPTNGPDQKGLFELDD